MDTIIFNISGMACGGCANTIANALKALDGVLGAEVSHVEATAEIRYDPARVQPEQLRDAVEQAGYRVVG